MLERLVSLTGVKPVNQPNYMFELLIPYIPTLWGYNLGNQVVFSLSVKSTTFQGMEAESEVISNINGKRTIPTRGDFTRELPLTVSLNQSGLQLETIKTWFMNCQNGEVDKNKADAIIILESLVGVPTRYMIIKGMYPKNIPEVELVMGGTDGFVELNIKFAYDEINFGDDIQKFMAFVPSLSAVNY